MLVLIDVWGVYVVYDYNCVIFEDDIVWFDELKLNVWDVWNVLNVYWLLMSIFLMGRM